MALGSLIRARRKLAGKTLEELGKETGFSASLVCKVELNTLNRPVPPLFLLKVSKALGIPFSDLVQASDESFTQRFERIEENFQPGDTTSFWRLLDFSRPESDHTKAEMIAVGDALYSIGQRIRQQVHSADLNEVAALFAYAKKWMEGAGSNRAAIAQAALASAEYVSAHGKVGEGLLNVGPSSAFACYFPVQESLTKAFVELVGLGRESWEHGWALFWTLREAGDMCRRLGKAVVTEESDERALALVSSMPSRITWIKDAQSSPESVQVQAWLTQVSPKLEDTVRIAAGVPRLNDALALFTAAEDWTDAALGNKEIANLKVNDACLVWRWRIDTANVIRDRLMLAKELGEACERIGAQVSTSPRVIRNSFQECVDRIRDAIEALRKIARSAAGRELEEVKHTLSWAHQEFGFLLKREERSELYDQAYWNYMISAELDPLRAPAAGYHSRAILDLLRAEAKDDRKASRSLLEVERRRTKTSFDSFDYSF